MHKKKIIFAIILVVFLLIFGRLLWNAVKLSPVLWQYLFNNKIELKKVDNRINILLLGIGGGVHEGPNLTDTIIFASLDPKTNRVTLVSLPRDLWVEDLEAKINTAYAFGEEKETGGGLRLAKAVVEKVVGQKVDYAVRVDFAGFVKAVDLVNGIEVNVERTFDDYQYPVEGKENDLCGKKEEEVQALATQSSELELFPCRYKHIHFDKGVTYMDGKTALEFVRSRHASGVEGTDFSRSQRQEKIIDSFKDKVLSLQILLNPVKVVSLYDAVSENIDTDVKQEEFDDFIKLAQKMKDAKIKSVVVDYGDSAKKRLGLLVNPPISQIHRNQWVLIPRKGNDDYSQIQMYVLCEIKGEHSCDALLK